MRPSEDRDGRSERARVFFERLYRIPGHGSSSRIFYISPPIPIFAMVEGTSPSSAGLDASPNPLVPTQAAGAAGPPPGRPPSKRALLITAAIVIVALVILAALLTGVLPGLRSSSGGNPGEALAYSAALPLANTAAANAPGGPWTLVIGTGYDVSAAFPFGGAIFLISHSMDLHYLTTARPDIPRFGGSLSSGLSPWWLFWYDNGTTGGIFGDANLLFVAVVDGTGIALATGTTTYNPRCPLRAPELPRSIVRLRWPLPSRRTPRTSMLIRDSTRASPRVTIISPAYEVGSGTPTSPHAPPSLRFTNRVRPSTMELSTAPR